MFHILNTSKPSVLFTTSDSYDRVKEVQQKCDFLDMVIDIDNVVYPEFNARRESYAYSGRHQIQPDDTALIIYTSGSTGLPKGVMLSHKAIIYPLELYR